MTYTISKNHSSLFLTTALSLYSLTILPPEVTLNIEIKGKQCVPALTKILQKTAAKIVISSFDWNQLIELRSHHKSIPIAILTDGKEPWSIAEQLNAIAVNPSIKQVDSKFVSQFSRSVSFAL